MFDLPSLGQGPRQQGPPRNPLLDALLGGQPQAEGIGPINGLDYMPQSQRPPYTPQPHMTFEQIRQMQQIQNRAPGPGNFTLPPHGK